MKSQQRTNCLKMVALLLVITLLCPTVFKEIPIEAHAENEQNLTTENVVTEIANTEELPLVSMSEVPDFVSQDQVEEFGHVSRLVDEEALNTLVYLNRDGTKTKYIMDYPVKYLDESGDAQFIDLSLTETSNAFTTTANDILLSVAKDYTNGITLAYNNYSVTLITMPVSNSSSGNISTAPIVTAIAANNAVTYNDVFGEGVDVRYTPLHNGVKEDIILEAYSNVSTFNFILNTGGLGVYSENGCYYLATAEDADMRMDLGKIVVYDSALKMSEGIMEVTSIKEGQLYQLTISVDTAFLSDSNTVYPVRIDPSITVSDTTHGAGAVTDCPVYSGKQTTNMGSAIYNPIGYLDSTYQTGRTAVKLTGLISDSTYQNLSANGILGAYFYIKDSSGTTAKTVNLYALTSNSTWTETSLTWSTVGTISSTLQASASVGGGAWSGFNITNLVKGWKSNSYNINCGFILQSANESTAGNFFSSESAEANWPYLALTYNEIEGGGSSFSTAVTLTLGSTQSVSINIANGTSYYTFTPTVTGTYVVQSSDYSGDPYVWMYDSSHVLYGSNDNGGNNANYNFWLSKTLYAGTKYYIRVGHRSTLTGSYNFTLLRVADVKDTFYKLKNVNSGQYLDIHGPGEQILVHQWTTSEGEQQKWYLEKIDDYYVIRSQYGNNKFVGIENTSTGVDNIKLYDTISDATKWTVYITASNNYIFEPKTAKCKALYSRDSSVGVEMRLEWIGSSGNKAKWNINSYDYSSLLTFSAFDFGDNANVDESALFAGRMEALGYVNIGTFNDATENVTAAKVKEIGRYSDIIYINGHGHGYANIQVRVDGGNVISEYFCAEDTVNTTLYPKTEVGAEWLYDGNYTISESYWNKGTKWGIFAPCAQLNIGADGEGAHWNGLNSAQLWGRTMLGQGARMHGYLGFFIKAPGTTTHYDRLGEFFDLCDEGKTLVNAWADSNTVIGVGSADWAAIYHAGNANDKFTSMATTSSSGSDYTIYYVGRDDRETGLVVGGTDSVSSAEPSAIRNTQLPVFVTTENYLNAANEKYIALQESLAISDADILKIENNGRICYSALNRNWGNEDIEYNLTNDQVITIAKQILNELGLLPQDGYRVGVTATERTRLDLTGENTYESEAIEYTVFFYRTYNGIDLISNDQDGILISFDKQGLTELSYLWRDISVTENVELAANNMTMGEILTLEEAQTIYFTHWDNPDEIESFVGTNDVGTEEWPFAKMAYLQTDNTTKLVWIFSTGNNYQNGFCIDAKTSAVLTE